jgi:hypothetical protein
MTKASLLILFFVLAARPVFSAEPTVDFDGKSKKAESVINYLNDKTADDLVTPSIPASDPSSGVVSITKPAGITDSLPDSTPKYLPGDTLKASAWCPATSGRYNVCFEVVASTILGHDHYNPGGASIVYDPPPAQGTSWSCYKNIPVSQRVEFLYTLPQTAINFDLHFEFGGACQGPVWNRGYFAGISTLVPLPPGKPGDGYQLEPGSMFHQKVHYATALAKNAVQAIAAQYLREFPIDPPLSILRISLPFGGLFDINADWRPPLATHRFGNEVDVMWARIPPENRPKFEEIVKANGAQLSFCKEGYYHIDFTPGVFQAPPCD